MNRPPRRFIRPLIVLALVTASLFFPGGSRLVSTAHAADARYWDPGFIISDQDFYNSNSMTATQIQAFLNQKGASCQPGSAPCLKNFTQTTTTWAPDAYCSGYNGAANETAATIIWRVGQACGISPQVLLVTLQKENSLVTKTTPSTGSYQTAMGYGCPDTAQCNTEFYGFFNQMYRAARQFKIYAAKPTSFNFHAGQTSAVPYNPKAGCGSSQVYIQNQATASLYNYTPYQPNAAALANLYGTGDSCSAYGNRNFWAFFNDWFVHTIPSGEIVKSSLSDLTYLINGDAKISLDSWAIRDALGLRQLSVVDASTLGKYPVQAGTLQGIVKCGSTYLGGIAGTVFPIQPQNTSTLPATVLADSVCQLLTRSTVTITGPVLVEGAGSSTVYALVNGSKALVQDQNDINALSGGKVFILSTAALNALPTVDFDKCAFTVISSQVPACGQPTPQWTITPDITGDGRPDLLKVDAQGTLQIYALDPASSSPVGTPSPVMGGSWANMDLYAPGDFDQDGHNDLIGRDRITGALYLYQGTGTSFSAPLQIGSGWRGMSITVSGDVSGDGYPDLLATYPDGSLVLYANAWLIKTGQYPFVSPYPIIGWGWNGYSLYSAGDLNSDGSRDLVSVDSRGGLWTYPGTGVGKFPTRMAIGTGWSPYSLSTGVDIDGNGRPDILARDKAGDLWLYPTISANTFGRRILLSTSW